MAFTSFQPSYRAQQLLFGFGIYRLILATSFTALAFLPNAAISILPLSNSNSLQLATLAYLVLSILGILLTVNDQLSRTSVIVVLITDILLLTLIMRFSGGVDTGLGNLLLISVGIGGLLLPLRQSLFIAAIAASSIIYTEFLPITRSIDRDLLQAALLGLGYFTETIFLQYVGQRVKTTEQLARAQADTILDLRHLNELIVQRMRTGIIVITHEGAIRLLNDASRDLLGITDKRPFWLIEPLFKRLVTWKQNPNIEIDHFQRDADHPNISISFAKLQPRDQSDIIIFVEDTGRMHQQAQQLKLASLGRLTASIAHEIRNPLGAISHAAQLLEENPSLEPPDKRLLTIIHNHTQRVNSIIETILELSRRRPSNVKHIKLSELISQCLDEREMHSEKDKDQITVDYSAQSVIELDVSQMKQVLHNLIDNGLRYSGQETNRRTLSIVIGKSPDTDQTYIDIEDNGIGVPEDQVKNLFEPFYTTENSGTGLGLYIAKELCEANRTQLSYLTDRSGGCFRLVFSHTISQK